MRGTRRRKAHETQVLDLLSHLCRAEAIIAAGGPHRISSPSNPHPRAPGQGLSFFALSKKHLSSSVSLLEKDKSQSSLLPILFKQTEISERTTPSALPSSNSYQKQRIPRRTEKQLIFQPAKGGRNTLQLRRTELVAETDRKTSSHKQQAGEAPQWEQRCLPSSCWKQIGHLSCVACDVASPLHRLFGQLSAACI